MTVATLGFKISTAPIDKGARKLDDMSGAAKRAERAAKGLGTSGAAAAQKVSAANQRAARSAQMLEKSYSRIPGAIKLVAAALITMGGAFLGIRKFVDNTIEAEGALRQMQSALSSTGGASGQTVESLQKMAASLQKVTKFGDETINSAQNMLLTFTKIGGDTFPRATEAVLDVATAMKTDLKSAAIQVGKALNDPKEGMTALSRSGITFSEGQKAVVKQLVETGQLAKAQAVILKELETQFGGSARAARLTLGGALTSLANVWGDLFEVGSGASNRLRGSIEALIKSIESPAFSRFVELIGVGMFNALTLAARGAGFVVDHLHDLFDILKVIVAAKVVVWVATLAGSLLQLAIAVRKVGIVMAFFSRLGKINITMMAALGAIVAKATGHFDAFAAGLEKVFNTAKDLLPEEIANGIDKTLDSLRSFDLESGAAADNFERLQNNAAGLADSFIGVGESAKMAAAAAKQATKDAATAAKTAAQQVADQISFTKDVAGGFITDLKSGLEQGKSVWSSFADAAVNALDKISSRLLDSALDGVFGGGGGLGNIFGSLFGGGGAGSVNSGASGVTLGGVYHTGGVAGAPGGASRAVASSVFNNAPRYHGGGVSGLKPNEVPAILERGETIIPNGQSGSSMQVPPAQIQVNIQGGDGNAQVSQRQEGNMNVVDVVLGEVRNDISGGGMDAPMSRFGAKPKVRRR